MRTDLSVSVVGDHRSELDGPLNQNGSLNDSFSSNYIFEIISGFDCSKRISRVYSQGDYSLQTDILETWLNGILTGHRVSDAFRILKSVSKYTSSFTISEEIKNELIQSLRKAESSSSYISNRFTEGSSGRFPDSITIRFDSIKPQSHIAHLSFFSDRMAIWSCPIASVNNFSQLNAVMYQIQDRYTFRVFLEGTIRGPVWDCKGMADFREGIVLSIDDIPLPVPVAAYPWPKNASLIFSSENQFTPNKTDRLEAQVFGGAHSNQYSCQPLLGTILCDVVIPYDPVNLRWLSASVESILNQVGADCVVHLIADGFTEQEDPALKFADHPRVRLYRNQSNIGPYRTMNRIFDRLETEFVAVQDSDDIALPHRIRYSIDTLERENAEIFGGAMRQFVSYEARDADSLKQLERNPIHYSGHKKWRLCPEGNIINGTLLLRRTTYEQMNGFAALLGSADLEFATRAHRSGRKVITVPEIVSLRRLHSTSLSHGVTHGSGTKSRMAAHEAIQKTYPLMVSGCDFQRFGSLTSERYTSYQTEPLMRPVIQKNSQREATAGKKSIQHQKSWIQLPNLEIHVSHACNLSCMQCTHFSNYNHKGMLSPEDADRQMGLWSERLLPRDFSLLGGEPALNPQLGEICRIARRHWPHSRLQLVTNGFLLHRHPCLPSILEETGTYLEISVHHNSAEYQERLKPVTQLIKDWESTYKLHVNWRSSSSRWYRAYRGEGETMLPYSDNNPKQSWQICRSKWCPQIFDDKLWKCPQMAYLSMQARKYQFDKKKEWQPYLAYTPLDSNCSDKELHEFVNRQVESCCGMCPAKQELFSLPSPLVHLKKKKR